MSEGTDRPLPDLFVVPDFDHARISVSFTAPRSCRSVEWQLLQDEAAIAAGSVRPEEPPALTSFEVEIPGFIPWTLSRPFLYVLRMNLIDQDGTVELRQPFGMRKFHVEGRQIYFNNRPLLVKGFIRGREAHDHPNLAGLPEEQYYAKNILTAKRYGFNLVRFHSRVPPDLYFDVADRLGLLVHIEMRRYYGKYQKQRELMDHDPQLVSEQDWRQMVLRLRNHPSLMVYCMGNEINAPGRNPQVKRIAELTRQLDPTRLFIDTCARGEYDRSDIDFDVQHMGYFCPFGRHYSMFDTADNWGIFGSVSGKKMVEADDEANPGGVTRRHITPRVPVIAHEVGHYTAYRDLDALAAKFAACGADKPWWIDELKKLVKAKGLEADYPRLLAASQRFQYIWWKQVLESVRKSPILCGFHFLQLADTERYENANGIVDCFDDPKGCNPEQFLRFNADTVLVADLPQRSFFEKTQLEIPIWLSHFSQQSCRAGRLQWELTSQDGQTVHLAGSMDDFELDRPGLRKLCTVFVSLPALSKPQALTLRCSLRSERGELVTANQWDLWAFPDRPQRVAPGPVAARLADVNLASRYPQLAPMQGPPRPEQLLIADRFDADVFQHLAAGGRAMVLYRIPENRDRQAPKEQYYLPSTRDRFKNVIWDRGHNQGGFIRPSAALGDFPHDGFIDFQFCNLIDDCDKIDLDDFPISVEPIIQGVDKASRDRFDVFTFKLRELQPGWTMRKFAYLFELAVGSGRLLVCGFNFTGLGRAIPEVCGLFEALVSYVRSDEFRPSWSISPERLADYLRTKASQPRIKERMMTQFWQLDAEPLESDRYWKQAEAYLREG